MVAPKYQRVLLKISGESLKGSAATGIDPDAVNYMAEQIGNVHRMGIELAIVIGGGNIWRGEQAERWGMDRSAADYSGMLATRARYKFRRWRNPTSGAGPYGTWKRTGW